MKATDKMVDAACKKAPNLTREHVRDIVQTALDAGPSEDAGHVMEAHSHKLVSPTEREYVNKKDS